MPGFRKGRVFFEGYISTINGTIEADYELCECQEDLGTDETLIHCGPVNGDSCMQGTSVIEVDTYLYYFHAPFWIVLRAIVKKESFLCWQFLVVGSIYLYNDDSSYLTTGFHWMLFSTI